MKVDEIVIGSFTSNREVKLSGHIKTFVEERLRKKLEDIPSSELFYFCLHLNLLNCLVS